MSQSVALARNTILQTAGKTVSIALGWVVVVAMTNYLGTGGFGAYTIMTTYLQFFGVAIDLGFVLVSSQLLAEAADQQRIFANLLAFRLVTSLALLAAAPLLIWFFPYSILVKQGVAVLTVAFIVSALLQVFTGLFQKELAMGRALAGELAGRAVLLGVVGYAVWHSRGLLFIAAGVVGGSCANFGLAALAARRFVRVRLAYDADVWRMIWRRAWPLAAGIIFNLVYFKIDTLILSVTHAESEVGIYGAAYRVLEVLITFPTMFMGLLLPLLVVSWNRGERTGFQRTLQQALDVILYLAWPLVVGAAFTAPRLAALFGPEFRPASLILWLLVLAAAVIFLGTYFGHAIVAIGRQRSMVAVYAAAALLGVVGYLAVIPPYGAVGAAAMTAMIEAFVAVLGCVLLRRWTDIRVSFSKLGLAVMASLPMAVFLWVAASWPLAALVLGAVVVYVSALYLMGVLPRQFLTAVLTTPASSAEQSRAHSTILG